jgi:hypothetical protein
VKVREEGASLWGREVIREAGLGRPPRTPKWRNDFFWRASIFHVAQKATPANQAAGSLCPFSIVYRIHLDFDKNPYLPFFPKAFLDIPLTTLERALTQPPEVLARSDRKVSNEEGGELLYVPVPRWPAHVILSNPPPSRHRRAAGDGSTHVPSQMDFLLVGGGSYGGHRNRGACVDQQVRKVSSR